MANISNTIDSDDPSHFLRLMLHEQSSDSATSVVARHLLGRGAATSTEIVTATRLSRASVSLALIDLRSRGVVVETNLNNRDRSTRGRGRPQMKQSIAAGIGIAAGVHFGLREIRILLSDAAHNKLADISLAVKEGYGPEEARLLLEENLESLTDELETTVAEMLGIGLAVATPVSSNGHIADGSNIPKWDGANLTELFADYFPCPVHVDNEMNCAAQSKMLWGAARGLRDFVYVTFDYAIGGAIVYDGHVRRATDGYSAEIGHMPLDHPGLPCRCGKAGCLETLASIDAVLKRMNEGSDQLMDFKDLVNLVERADQRAIQVVGEAAQRCGQALAMISSILSPSHYLLDGNMTRLGVTFLDPLRATFSDHSRGRLPEIIDVTESFDDAVRGAAGLVFNSHGRLPYTF